MADEELELWPTIGVPKGDASLSEIFHRQYIARCRKLLYELLAFGKPAEPIVAQAEIERTEESSANPGTWHDRPPML